MVSSDIQLLKTFKECLDITTKISQSKKNGWMVKPSYRVQFSNAQLYRWLLKIGLSPAKTYNIGPLSVPDKYFPDFLRGHLDGDGSIWTYKDRWNSFKNPKYVYIRLWTRFLSASEIHIKWIRESIIRLLNIKGHTWEGKPQRSYQTTSLWQLKFAKKDSLKLLTWLYYNSKVPCLMRKRKIAEKFISI